MKNKCNSITDKIAQSMKDTMDAGSDLDFVKMSMDICELPYRGLTPMVSSEDKVADGKDFNHPDPPGSEAGGSRIHRAVVGLVRQERVGKAMQRLMSNGSAGNSKEVYDDMVSMHPKRKDPLK